MSKREAVEAERREAIQTLTDKMASNSLAVTVPARTACSWFSAFLRLWASLFCLQQASRQLERVSVLYHQIIPDVILKEGDLLAVWWLRIRLAMNGMWIQSLVGRLRALLWSNRACMPQEKTATKTQHSQVSMFLKNVKASRQYMWWIRRKTNWSQSKSLYFTWRIATFGPSSSLLPGAMPSAL